MSRIDIVDNSGAQKVMLFAVNGKNNRASAGLGDLVMGSVKKASVGGKVKKGDKVLVLIVGLKRKVQRKDGNTICFSKNVGLVVKRGKKGAVDMIGTRVFGPIAREIRDAGHTKIVSLAEEVL